MLSWVDLERLLYLLDGLLDAHDRLVPLLEVRQLQQRSAPSDQRLDVLWVFLHFQHGLLLCGLEEDEPLELLRREAVVRTLARHLVLRANRLESVLPPLSHLLPLPAGSTPLFLFAFEELFEIPARAGREFSL